MTKSDFGYMQAFQLCYEKDLNQLGLFMDAPESLYTQNARNLGPVVQSVISLTSSLWSKC